MRLDAIDHLKQRRSDNDLNRSSDALVERIAQGLGIEAERARAWALLRAVDNALWSLNISASPAADLAKAIALMG